jgi:hypothetical protein
MRSPDERLKVCEIEEHDMVKILKTPFEASAWLGLLTGILLLAACPNQTAAQNAFLQMRNGYFWDPATADYFLPRGVAYQIWNPPVGANQSTNQVDYDFVEFKKMYANSVRAELTWGQVEVGPNQFDWTRADFLVQRAQELGLKLFIIIGYQYPPSWFPKSWRGSNSLGLREDVLNCLATTPLSNALSCLPQRTADFLTATNSPASLAKVLNCLVTGAQAGGLSNILDCLEATLSQDELDANLPYLLSDVINYENPAAQAVYSNYIYTVTDHFKNSPTIGAWILGNEYAYFDLWEDRNVYNVHRFLGYDPISQQSFREYLKSLYQTNIAALNANWQTSYSDFNSVVMPLQYPSNRLLPGYQDVIQWRKRSIGNYVALGAVAAQKADPNHLRTYSMVGGIFNGLDANYTCEDAKAIVASCAAAGAPLHFWSINNYPWCSLGSELRSANFGIAKYHAESGLPVMISETGHSSTENFFDAEMVNGVSISGGRQPEALPSTMWESLLDGAIGVHFFNWNDRSLFTQAYDYRERGFGVVEENRLPKPNNAYQNVVAMFRQMANLHLQQLLGGSRDAASDVQFFWSTNADMVWPRANEENAMIWGALSRLGLQPGIIDDEGFARGAFTNAPALLLSRCYQMDPLDLQRVASNVIPAGIHVHAQADLPGQFDAYDRTNASWAAMMRNIFGVDVSGATVGLDDEATNDCYAPIYLYGATALGPITSNFTNKLLTWKVWRNVIPVSAKTVLTVVGTNVGACSYPDPTPYPALLVNSSGTSRGKTAVNPFAVGDTLSSIGLPGETALWDTRYSILHAIYLDHFGLKPTISLSGDGSQHILPRYRVCSNGSVLIALLNEDTNTSVVTISAPLLLTGRAVEDVSSGGILTRNSNGTLTYTNQGDECVVLYAYPRTGAADSSLINPNANKIWFQDAPLVIWPASTPASVSLGYDLVDSNLDLRVSLEQVSPLQTVYAQTTLTNLSGAGSVAAQLTVPDADPNNPNYVSSHKGAEYVFHATFLQAGSPVSDVAIPVRLVFGVHPTQPLPNPLVPGKTFPIELAWEELPSYAPGDVTPLDRAVLWDSALAGLQHYSVVLELLNSAGSVVASNAFLTTAGTGSTTLNLKVPTGVNGPFTWNAYVETATNVASHNIEESFEGFERGALWPFMASNPTNFMAPWYSFTYVAPQDPPFTNWLNEGIGLFGSDGSQSAFMVITNPAWVTTGTFGLIYDFDQFWPLPTNSAGLAAYQFSYDFNENNGYPYSMEMQIKDSSSNWIQYAVTNYPTDPNQWFTLKATLDQFQPLSPPASGPFDPTHFKTLVLSIRMLATNVVYVGFFDNIHFTGPETNLGGGIPSSYYTSANDSAGWLSIEPNARGAAISWVGNGVLQSANAVTGPWLDLTNAPNPYLKTNSASQFFRLRR